MKHDMKKHTITKLAAITALSLCGMTSATFAGNGTDILHYTTKAAMSAPDSDAVGKVDIKVRKQGNADKESLIIRLRGLELNADYQIQFLGADGLAYGDPIAFSSDDEGRAYLESRNGNGNSSPKKTAISLPEGLDILDVTGVVVQVPAQGPPPSEPVVVLQAALGSAGAYHYLVKKNIKEGDIRGTLRVMSNGDASQFRLLVVGVDSSSTVQLGLNGEYVQNNLTDEKGRVVITAPLSEPVDVLALESVQLAYPDTDLTPPDEPQLIFSVELP
jgi:hypothetical protein